MFGGGAAEVTAGMGQMIKNYWGNITGWDNAEYYALWDELNSPEAMGSEKRKEIAWRLQEILLEEAAFVPLGVGITGHIIGPRVRWTPRFDQFVYPWEMYPV
jgi:ABC-type transport system substrate-binding protein